MLPAASAGLSSSGSSRLCRKDYECRFDALRSTTCVWKCVEDLDFTICGKSQHAPAGKTVHDFGTSAY
jgi:hypothetical protein